MADYKPLSDSAVDEIATSYFNERQHKTFQQEQPTIVLVGGQPGAGKSVAAVMVRAEMSMQGGYVHVDADRLRERIRVGDSKPTSEETQADPGRLVAVLRGHATQGRRNIVEEGTFRNPGGMAKFIQGRHELGYKVELLAVATSREESLLGIYQRYEIQHAAGLSNPRYVSESYHDEAINGFDSTVARTETLLARARVVNRNGEVLYDSAVQDNDQANPLDALNAGRKLTDSNLFAITKAWGSIEAAAQQRNAPSSYLASVNSHTQRLDGMQKQRIHDHAMNQLDAHVTALVRDTRYSQHTGSELAKAAYFRGIHEKASEFSGVEPDFTKYDATVANRQTLQRFPDERDLVGRVAPLQIRVNDENSL